jgi:hypothetical protein
MLDCEDCMNYKIDQWNNFQEKCRKNSKHFPRADISCFKQFPFHHNPELPYVENVKESERRYKQGR